MVKKTNETLDAIAEKAAEDMLKNAELKVDVNINDVIKQIRQTIGFAPSWYEKAAWFAGGFMTSGAITAGSIGLLAYFN